MQCFLSKMCCKIRWFGWQMYVHSFLFVHILLLSPLKFFCNYTLSITVKIVVFMTLYCFSLSSFLFYRIEFLISIISKMYHIVHIYLSLSCANNFLTNAGRTLECFGSQFFFESSERKDSPTALYVSWPSTQSYLSMVSSSLSVVYTNFSL